MLDSGGVEEVSPADTGLEDFVGLQHEGKTFAIETYGCQVPSSRLVPLASLESPLMMPVLLQMNVADSEVVRAVMGGAGYNWTDSTEEADVVFLNTCAIRGA